MCLEAQPYIPVEEYLAREATAPSKSEYFNGTVYGMAVGTPEHSLIAVNALCELYIQLRERPCRPYNSDQRVLIEATGLRTYPDISIVCGPARYDPQSRQNLLNPIVIIEVLSESTEAYDRGDKFAHYSLISSLREYVLVSSHQKCIERFTRQEGDTEWTYTRCMDPEGSLALSSISCTLDLPAVYREIDLPEKPLRRQVPREELA